VSSRLCTLSTPKPPTIPQPNPNPNPQPPDNPKPQPQQGRRALAGVHTVILLLDATTLLDSAVAMQRRDIDVATMAIQNGKGLVVAISKADLVEGGREAAEQLREQVANVLEARLTDAGRVPVVMTAALVGEGRERVMEATVGSYVRWNKRCAGGVCLCCVWGLDLRTNRPTGCRSLRSRWSIYPHLQLLGSCLLLRSTTYSCMPSPSPKAHPYTPPAPRQSRCQQCRHLAPPARAAQARDPTLRLPRRRPARAHQVGVPAPGSTPGVCLFFAGRERGGGPGGAVFGKHGAAAV